MQKSVVFLYTKYKQHEKEMKKNNPIYNNIKKNKILRNKLNQRNTKTGTLTTTKY